MDFALRCDFVMLYSLQVEKDQKFIPYVWTVTVSSSEQINHLLEWRLSDLLRNLSLTLCSFSLFFFSEVEQRIHFLGSRSVLWN